METREQSARSYTLSEIDAMRSALRERWIRRRFPLQSDGSRGGAYDGAACDKAVQDELIAAMVGNVDPADVLAECDRTP